MRAGMAVPEGFVLTTDALDGHSADLAIQQLPQRRDARRRGATNLSTTVLSAGVREALAGHAAPLLAQGPVVVRSSAVGEDAPRNRSPGNSTRFSTSPTTCSSSGRCSPVWASLWSERVGSIDARAACRRGMGVVVQQQVDARVAGVLFTSVDWRDARRVRGGLADSWSPAQIDPGRLAIDRDRCVAADLRPQTRVLPQPSGRSSSCARGGCAARDASLVPRRTSSGRSTGERLALRRPVAADHGARDDPVAPAANGTTDLVVERERQRELSAADLAAALLDRVGWATRTTSATSAVAFGVSRRRAFARWSRRFSRSSACTARGCTTT